LISPKDVSVRIKQITSSDPKKVALVLLKLVFGSKSY
jgi:hypothetical protein